MTQQEYEQLQSTDQMLISNLFNCSSSVPIELLFLEMGLIPIKQIIQMRRCLYLHHILQQSEDSVLFKFFMAQLKENNQGDWSYQVLRDLEEFQIKLEIEEIQNMSNEKYKVILKEAVKRLAFNLLMAKKEGRKSENAKGKHIIYSELKMAQYLTSENFDATIEEKKFLFQCRVDDLELKGNKKWKYENIICNNCDENSIETQRHILFCKPLLRSNQILTYIPDYEELFGDDIEAQVYAARILKDNYSRRKP